MFSIIIYNILCKICAWAEIEVVALCAVDVCFLCISGLIDPAETLSLCDGPYWVPERWHLSWGWHQGKPEIGITLGKNHVFSKQPFHIFFTAFIFTIWWENIGYRHIILVSLIHMHLHFTFGELSEQRLSMLVIKLRHNESLMSFI